jgi:uncharacterized protein (DUF362 family)
MAGLPGLASATAFRDVVSIVRIRSCKGEAAVEEAIELLGGIPALSLGKERILYPEVQLHRSLIDTDLLCSVPMMKTHCLATVSLGMKNLMGLYAGTVYGTVRSEVHSHVADRGLPGVDYEILDMVRANKLGLVVIDASKAMDGNGPVEGHAVGMGLIIAGTNPLATDMVAAPWESTPERSRPSSSLTASG